MSNVVEVAVKLRKDISSGKRAYIDDFEKEHPDFVLTYLDNNCTVYEWVFNDELIVVTFNSAVMVGVKYEKFAK